MASADSTVCAEGSGAGQCENPQGLATDFETGRLYVADRGNNRIDVFNQEGIFLFAFGWGVDTGANALQKCTMASACQAGIAGTGAGQLSGPRRVAVDNSNGPSKHDVYVLDSNNRRLEKFDVEGNFLGQGSGPGEGPGQINDTFAQLAVGPEGSVYVGDTLGEEATGLEPRVEKFSEAGAFVEQCKLAPKKRFVRGLAIGVGGVIYAAFGGAGIYEFEAMSSCGELAAVDTDPSLEMGSLGIDDAGDLYAGQSVDRAPPHSGYYRTVVKLDSALVHKRRYGFHALGETRTVGIAPDKSGGKGVFAAEEFGPVRHLDEPLAGPLVVTAETPKPVGNVKTTLEAEVDPESAATTYHFEYVTQESFEEEGGWASPEVIGTTPMVLGAPAADVELHLATATIGCAKVEDGGCLLPETDYRFRVIAKHAGGEEGSGPVEGTFETEPTIRIEETYASGVGVDAAKLSLKVNPLGFAATGWFEYVDDAGFKANGFADATQVPAVGEGANPLGFGSGTAGVIKASVVALSPSTLYHLRARANNATLLEPATGEEVLFSTFAPEAGKQCPENPLFRVGASARLPDCRVYELVSPLGKEGGDVISQTDVSGYEAALSQSADSGNKLAFGSYRAFGEAEAAPRTSQYISERTAEGWKTHYALGQRGRLNEKAANQTLTEPRLYSPDLCQSWIKTYTEPPLAPKALKGQMNLYWRTDQAANCGGKEGWEALTTVPPSAPAKTFGLSFELQGAAADGSAAIYAAQASLTANTPAQPGECASLVSKCELHLYYQEKGEGEPHFTCVLPNGNPESSPCAAAGTLNGFGEIGRNSQITGAISADGSRVFWGKGAPGEGKIYVRENPGAVESAGKDGEGNCVPEAGKACTIAVSVGSAQFWAATPDGNKAIYTENETLYEFEVDTKTRTPIAEEALGVAGESADLSRIYLGSRKVLTTEPNSVGKVAVAGKGNLYLYEAGNSFQFIGTLVSSGDITRALNPKPVLRTAHTTSDAGHLAFMSEAPLTGYDNTDAGSPERCGGPGGKGVCDAEVFIFDATSETLRCASCNPSGGRPAGTMVEGLSAAYSAAAWLPIWYASLHAGRTMSEDGSRLYFEAADALDPYDTNGQTDVYQWEEAGAGSCKASDPSYSVQDEACIKLISSGEAEGAARLMDTSASGDDVFFTTAQSLVPSDYGLIDAYDARVGGGLPEPESQPVECEGESCQNPAPTPEHSAPGSLGYQGPGNVAYPPKKPKKCPKGKVKRGGKCVKKCPKGKVKRGGKCVKKHHAKQKRKARER